MIKVGDFVKRNNVIAVEEWEFCPELKHSEEVLEIKTQTFKEMYQSDIKITVARLKSGWANIDLVEKQNDN